MLLNVFTIDTHGSVHCLTRSTLHDDSSSRHLQALTQLLAAYPSSELVDDSAAAKTRSLQQMGQGMQEQVAGTYESGNQGDAGLVGLASCFSPSELQQYVGVERQAELAGMWVPAVDDTAVFEGEGGDGAPTQNG